MGEVEPVSLRTEYFHERRDQDENEGAEPDQRVPIDAPYKDGAKVGSDANFSRGWHLKRPDSWSCFERVLTPTTEQNFHGERFVNRRRRSIRYCSRCTPRRDIPDRPAGMKW